MNVVLKPIRFWEFCRNRHIPSLQPGNNQITVQASSSNRLGLSIILFLEKKGRSRCVYYTRILPYFKNIFKQCDVSSRSRKRFRQENTFDKANSRRNMRKNIHKMQCLVKIILKANDNLRFV